MRNSEFGIICIPLVCNKNAENNYKTDLFSRKFSFENRSIRLFHKRFTMRNGKLVPYGVQYEFTELK